MAHAYVGVRHVTGFDGLGRRTRWRQVRIDHPFTRPRSDVVNTGVTGDLAVVVGPQRHDAGGVASGRTGSDVIVHDGVGPLAVEVQIVANRIQIPGTHARRTA